MHLSKDVAGIILEFSTDTVLSLMERMCRICLEIDVHHIVVYIAMEEWHNQDVVLTGNPLQYIVEWRDNSGAKNASYNIDMQIFEFQDIVIPCTSLKQFDQLLIEHGIHTTQMYSYKNPLDKGHDEYKFKEEMIDLLTSIKL